MTDRGAGDDEGQTRRRREPVRPRREFDDDNNEMAHRDQTLVTALLALMADPVYAALCSETVDLVNRHSALAEATLDDAEQALADAECPSGKGALAL